jgi:hypothetical protein
MRRFTVLLLAALCASLLPAGPGTGGMAFAAGPDVSPAPSEPVASPSLPDSTSSPAGGVAQSAPATATTDALLATSVLVTSSDDEPALDQAVDLTATVTPDPGPGTIKWFVDDVLKASTALEAGGVAHWTTSFALPYGHIVKAQFVGNAVYAGSTGYDNFHLLPIPTTTTLQLPASPMPAGVVKGTVKISPVPSGGFIEIRTSVTGITTVAVDADGVTDVTFGTFKSGSYTASAVYLGHGQYAGSRSYGGSFSVLDVGEVAIATNRITAVQGELPVTLSATLSANTGPSGTVTFLDTVGGVVQKFGPFVVDPTTLKATYTSSALRIGIHTIRARYDGAPGYRLPATSTAVTVTVVADTAVHATFKAGASSFYAYKDGYRDTVSLSGVLDETATVTIRIYSATGSLKRTISLGTKGIGAFSTTWNGRTATGVAVAAGTYTIKATFKDLKAHTRLITAYTTVSWRQVAWKTAPTILRYGDQLAYYGTAGSALYVSNDYSRGRTLYSGEFNRYCDPCDTIYGITTYQLSTTALALRNIQVTATGHTFLGSYHPGETYVIRPGTTSKVMVGNLPEYLAQPMTTSVSPAYVGDRKLTFLIWCSEQWGDFFDVHHLKLNYQYAVWK